MNVNMSGAADVRLPTGARGRHVDGPPAISRQRRSRMDEAVEHAAIEPRRSPLEIGLGTLSPVGALVDDVSLFRVLSSLVILRRRTFVTVLLVAGLDAERHAVAVDPLEPRQDLRVAGLRPGVEVEGQPELLVHVAERHDLVARPGQKAVVDEDEEFGVAEFDVAPELRPEHVHALAPHEVAEPVLGREGPLARRIAVRAGIGATAVGLHRDHLEDAPPRLTHSERSG